MVGLAPEAAHVEWAEVDLLEETCSREQATGSVPIRKRDSDTACGGNVT